MSVKFLTRMEAESWCLKNGIHVVGGKPKPYEEHRIPALGFSIPEDAGARTSLARILYPNAEDGELLIWTTDWSVWPSGEHLPLMRRLREALGERGPSSTHLPNWLVRKASTMASVCLL